jgi:uncharacterized protein YkwD
MRKTLLFLITLVAFLVFVTGCPFINNPLPNITIPQAILDMEMDTHVAINAERAAGSCGALTMDEGLRTVARAHSQDMIDRSFFDHTNPDGDNVGGRLTEAGISYAMAGENIAWNMGYADPVAIAVDGWMNSPGHRANILRAEFTHTGIGIAVTTDNVYYFTQVFTDPSKSSGSPCGEIYTYGPIRVKPR